MDRYPENMTTRIKYVFHNRYNGIETQAFRIACEWPARGLIICRWPVNTCAVYMAPARQPAYRILRRLTLHSPASQYTLHTPASQHTSHSVESWSIRTRKYKCNIVQYMRGSARISECTHVPCSSSPYGHCWPNRVCECCRVTYSPFRNDVPLIFY